MLMMSMLSCAGYIYKMLVKSFCHYICRFLSQILENKQFFDMWIYKYTYIYGLKLIL